MSLGAVILAAGAGSRLGGVAKALLPIGDETYLARIVRTARSVGVRDVVVVVGPPYGADVAAAARELARNAVAPPTADARSRGDDAGPTAPTNLRIVENPAPSRGMASSVAIGFAVIAATDVDAAWLWPVDHPFVAVNTLVQLADALGGHAAAQPRFGGRGGHPPLVARALFSALAGCTDAPGGARDVLARADVIAVEVDDAGVVRDVDTPRDLAEAG